MNERKTEPVIEDCAATLHKLSRVLRQAQYSKSQDSHQTDELYRSHVNNEILSRLQRTAQAAYLQALECCRAEAKIEFTELYTTSITQIEKLTDDAGRRHVSISSGFLTSASETIRDQTVHFITRLRTEPLWVAERLSLHDFEGSDLDVDMQSTLKVPRHTSTTRHAFTGRDPAGASQRSSIVDSLVFAIFAPPGACKTEDHLRLELSASIMQILIEDGAKGCKSEAFCLATFDAWQSIHGWQSVKSFEILLMDILQSGSKLLTKAEERERESTNNQAYYFSATKRGNLEEEFFFNATRRIMNFLNSDPLGVLPRGVSLLFRAICSRIPVTHRSKYESFVICRWFFSHFLGNAIKYPERLGIFKEYYISDSYRHHILFALERKVQTYCVPSSHSVSNKRNPMEEEIEALVISIYSRLNHDVVATSDLTLHESGSLQAKDLSAYSATAVPTICLSAEDISLLLKALLANARSPGQSEIRVGTSALSRGHSTSSTKSKKSESRYVQKSRIGFAVGSAIPDHDSCSTGPTEVDDALTASNTCTRCDTTPISVQDPDTASIGRLSAEIHKWTAQRSCNMDQTTADWQLLFIDDGQLTCTEPQASENVLVPEAPDVVHTAIMHLVETFDLTCPVLDFSRPERGENFNFVSARSTVAPSSKHRDLHGSINGSSRLLQLLVDAGAICFRRHDHNLANIYYKAHDKLRRKWFTAESIDDYAPIICGMVDEQDRLIENYKTRYEARSYLIAFANDRSKGLLKNVKDLMNSFRKLRLKMWYAVDIRPSKLWTQSWEVVRCLNKMGDQAMAPSFESTLDNTAYSLHRPSPLSRTNSKDRRLPRFLRDTKQGLPNSNSTGLFPVDNVVYEAVAAPYILGGRNKLNNGQAQQTSKWMQIHEVHNFCVGEERIHRLCFEIDDLICRLTNFRSADIEGLTLQQATTSLLWNYELFRYEKTMFGIRQHEGHSMIANSTKLHDRDYQSGLLRRGSAGDLLGVNHSTTKPRGNSIGSFEKPMFRSRSHTSSSQVTESSLLDPFYSGGEAEAGLQFPSHVGSFVPVEISMCITGIDLPAVRDFLLQSQISLTSLLVSDFAGIMYCRGSETDQWTHDDLTELACTQHIQESRIDRISMANLLSAKSVGVWRGNSNLLGSSQFDSHQPPPTHSIRHQ